MNHQPYTMEVQPRPPPPLSNLSPMQRGRLPALRTSALTTAGNGNPYGHGSPLSAAGHGLTTPLSTTSLSTPFAQSARAAFPAGSHSPMMGRATPSSPAMPYNPQQWGRPNGAVAPMHMQNTTQTVRYAPRLVGPDEPMASPPPPYSAEPPESLSDTSSTTTTDRSRDIGGSSTASAATSASGVGLPTGSSGRASNAAPHMGSPIVASATFPPPPPPSAQARSSSRSHAERLLNAVAGRAHGVNSPQHPEVVQAQYQYAPQVHMSIPPTARRAASASALGNAYPSRAGYNNSPVQEAALPPPPPGPPPSMPRSQSARPSGASIVGAGPVPTPLTSRSRQPVARGSNLGPVPPTPLDWQETEPSSPNESITSERQITSQRPLHVETTNFLEDHLTQSPASDEANNTPNANMGSRPRGDSGTLMRSPAVRNRSSQGIRDRRNESRRSRTSEETAGTESTDLLSRPLKDIVVSNDPPNRRASARVTPRSGRFRGFEDALKSNDTVGSPRVPNSARSTTSHQGQNQLSPTSPRSPYSSNQARPGSAKSSRKISGPKSLQTPLSADERPLSHLLHIPNDDSVHVPPLRPESSLSLVDVNETEGSENNPAMFAKQAMQRYRLFAQQEANARNDSERLQLFAQFMVAESQLRREKYATVFREEEIKVPELLDGVFEADPNAEPAVATATPVQLARQIPVSTSVPGSRRSSSSSVTESGTASSRPVSASSNSDPPHLTLDTTVNDPRSRTFVPALSPIASMSAVTGRDDLDSRGRAPSRWWETGSNPSQPGDGFDVFKRSKRETKYMSAVLENEVISSTEETFHTEPSSSQAFYGANEYPPEKTGWYESSSVTHPKSGSPASDPADARKLDISRLITLPPPYPRHHPAVNNNHPDLADVRNTVRALNEKSAITEAQEHFQVQISDKHKRCNSWCEHQRSMHHQDMQFRIERNEISQREYDVAEAALETKLKQSRKELAQSTFDLFQSMVATPVLALLADRLRRADESFAALAGRLQSDADTHSPNLPQEAGDEKPELLEKLTMLKWLFEARESLYREKHSILTQRNTYYKAVICTQYEVDGNTTKVAEAEAFFASDARQRQAAADAANLQRWTTFTAAIEAHVTRGVEVQLSALWDIAPPLQSLLQRIPAEELDGFEIRIPRNELEENPSYWLHPLRYLYSVLVHAEASSRQFVDGQISLWCLLQEAREGLAGAKWRARRSQQSHESGRDVPEGLDAREANAQAAEERRMVDDLKERVAAAEEQWIEGLGGAVTGIKEGVRVFLEETSGWDEELESGE